MVTLERLEVKNPLMLHMWYLMKYHGKIICDMIGLHILDQLISAIIFAKGSREGCEKLNSDKVTENTVASKPMGICKYIVSP